MRDRYPLEGWIALKADDHQADIIRGGCMCGFAVWSPEHVAIMAYRDAVDSAPIRGDATTEPPVRPEKESVLPPSAVELASLRGTGSIRGAEATS